MTVSLESLSVLLVEPSNAQRKIIESLFHTIGVNHVHCVGAGAQAMHMLAETTVDVVVSAMHLPDMTGTDLILKIRTGNVQRNIPFMLVSSETHYRYLEPIRQAGVIATLPKPFQSKQLERAKPFEISSSTTINYNSTTGF